MKKIGWVGWLFCAPAAIISGAIKSRYAKRICMRCISVLLAIYTVVACFFFKNLQLMAFYYIFLELQVVFDCTLLRVVRKDASARWVQGLCTSASLLIVGFVIAISVFPYPTRPAIFFPPVLVGMAAIFIFSYERLILLLTGYAAVFAALVMILNAPGPGLRYLEHYSRLSDRHGVRVQYYQPAPGRFSQPHALDAVEHH